MSVTVKIMQVMIQIDLQKTFASLKNNVLLQILSVILMFFLMIPINNCKKKTLFQQLLRMSENYVFLM